MTVAYPILGRRTVLEYMPDETAHRRDMARAVNELMAGHNNASLDVTLDPGAAFTTITDPRISIATAVVMVPATLSAAAAVAAGTLYVTPTKGVATIHHANTVVADRTFKVVLLG
jgi:hypothetical protein